MAFAWGDEKADGYRNKLIRRVPNFADRKGNYVT